ncbi:MAG: DUF488 domain-containing protein [Chloroflexi bacterium]|nr:DUF488 domain-containing protein [Chloroflexota bacterium]
MRLFTIGYSKRSMDEFIGMLREHEIPVLADVRMWAGSRFKPEFSKNRLASALWASGIAYVNLRALGNAGKFTGAGRVVIHDPEEGFPELAALLERYGSVAIMCLERDPNECHRMDVAVEMARQLPDLEVTHLGMPETLLG